VHDSNGLYLDAFVEIYYETMRRVGATPIYFFPRAYFRKLSDGLGERLHLFVCLHEGKVMCGGLLTECGGIFQYHLGGTSNAALKFAPMKLLHDVTRMWANDRKLQFYHLGGGATMRPDDSLLHFKLGFSGLTHEFKIWRWVVFADVYRRLCAEKSRWNEQNGLVVADADFFPDYRAPVAHPVLQPPCLVTGGTMCHEPTLPEGANS
jgi:hypothetical protein